MMKSYYKIDCLFIVERKPMNIINKLHFYIFVFLFCALQISYAGTSGKISGKITDATTKDGLPGAIILIDGTKLGVSTDIDGTYRILNVPPGKYSVRISMIAYTKTVVNEVEVKSDETTNLNIALKQESIDLKEVVVRAERPPIQKDKTYSSATISTQTIEMMPVTSVKELISQQAGVVSSGGELHFRGGRGREVAYIIDGIPVSNAYNQSGGTEVNVENNMIQELSVLSGTFNAEYGSAQSGVVNIVTRRPEKVLSGSVSTYFGDWVSDKQDIYVGIKKINPISEGDIQMSLTGPLLIENLSFFASGRFNKSESPYWYERRFVPLDGWRIAAYDHWFREHNPASVGQTQAVTIPDSLGTGDRAQGPLTQTNAISFTGKIDYQPTSYVRFNYQIFGSSKTTTGGGQSRRYQPDETSTSQTLSLNQILSFHHFITEQFFYNIGIYYQHNTNESFYRKDNRIAKYPGDAGIQLIDFSADGFSLGTTGGFYTGAPGKNYRDLFLVNGDFNFQIDHVNLIKAGFEFKQHNINTYYWPNISTPEWQNYKWPSSESISAKALSYNQYWNALIDYWKKWDSTYNTTRYRPALASEYTLWRDYTIKPMQWSVYVQDKLELGEIIVNAGVRFDAFDPKEKVPIKWNAESYNLGAPANVKNASVKYQLSPRFGLSFPISNAGAFHASYGHFFQMPSFQYMYNTPVQALTALQLEGITLGNANLEPEKTVSYEVGLQQEIVTGLVADVTAYYKDFRNLLGIEQITTIDAVGYKRFINRDYGYSKGFTLSLQKNGEGLITGAINYTLSFSNGSSSDPQSIQLVQAATQYGGQAVTFLQRQILPLDWDQRKTLNSFVNFGVSGSWNLGIYGYVATGLPYSPTFIERFDILDQEYRQSGSKPFKWSVDLKATTNLKIFGQRTSVYLKVDNVFDHLNEDQVYASTGQASNPARLPDRLALELTRLAQEGLFNLHDIDNHPEYYSLPRKITLGFEWRF